MIHRSELREGESVVLILLRDERGRTRGRGGRLRRSLPPRVRSTVLKPDRLAGTTGLLILEAFHYIVSH